MISDLTLMHRFSGGNRRYLIRWDTGEEAWFRARNMREAQHIARTFTGRLKGRKLLSVTKRDGLSEVGRGL